MFFPRNLRIRIFILLLIAVTACSPAEIEITPTFGPTAVLFPYQTPTPTQQSTSVESAELNLPTPTPATYVVAQGDTLIGIATRLGLSLDALMAANPGVEPRLLTPGTSLLLPGAGGAGATGIPTPTPVPLTVGETKCYSSAAGELWCFVIVENTLTSSVENLTAVVQLLSANGEVLANLQATPPLNLLVSGEAMPLVAYTSDPPEGWTTARGQLLSAYSLDVGSDYYVEAVIQESDVDIAEDGWAARIVGRVEIQEGEAGTVWVLAVAYDGAGNVIGVRRWESEGEKEFDFRVYSLGLEIASVDLLVEARR